MAYGHHWYDELFHFFGHLAAMMIAIGLSCAAFILSRPGLFSTWPMFDDSAKVKAAEALTELEEELLRIKDEIRRDTMTKVELQNIIICQDLLLECYRENICIQAALIHTNESLHATRSLLNHSTEILHEVEELLQLEE